MKEIEAGTMVGPARLERDDRSMKVVEYAVSLVAVISAIALALLR